MTGWKRQARGWSILFALVVLVVGGFLVGRRVSSTAFAKSSPAPSQQTQPATPARPLRLAPGFPRSREGAAGAAASYSMAFVRVALAGRRAREHAYAGITTRHSRTGLLELASSTEGVLRRNLSPGSGPVVLRGAPLGYRVVSFTPARAVVDVWSVGIVEGSARPATATWQSTLVTLEWEGDRWRLDAFRSAPGLTPASSARAVDPAGVLADGGRYGTYATLLP